MLTSAAVKFATGSGALLWIYRGRWLQKPGMTAGGVLAMSTQKIGRLNRLGRGLLVFWLVAGGDPRRNNSAAGRDPLRRPRHFGAAPRSWPSPRALHVPVGRDDGNGHTGRAGNAEKDTGLRREDCSRRSSYFEAEKSLRGDVVQT